MMTAASALAGGPLQGSDGLVETVPFLSECAEYLVEVQSKPPLGGG